MESVWIAVHTYFQLTFPSIWLIQIHIHDLGGLTPVFNGLGIPVPIRYGVF